MMTIEIATSAKIQGLQTVVDGLVAANKRRDIAEKVSLACLVRGEIVCKLVDCSVDFVYYDVAFRERTRYEITSWAQLRRRASESMTNAQARRWEMIEQRLDDFHKEHTQLDAERFFTNWRDSRAADPWSIMPERSRKSGTREQVLSFINDLVHNESTQTGAKKVLLECAVNTPDWLARETGRNVDLWSNDDEYL